MRQLFLFGLVLASALFGRPADAAWNPDWKQRARIVLNTAADGLPVSAPIESVPVLVRLHTGNFSFVDAKPDGTDLRFIAADDKTPLKFHIEKFDGLNELALVWVQVPRLAANSKTDHVWLYYGNPAAAAADDAKGTYDAAQGLVYHFGDTQPSPQDTTANANHATRSTATASGAGLIGGALAFDGTGELALPATPSLQAGPGGWTLSFWVKPADAADAPIVAQSGGAAALRLGIRGGKFVAQAGSLVATSSATVAPGAWQHVAIVAGNGLALYVNGVETARAAGATPETGGATTFVRGFKGEIDEVQVARTARPADWIRASALSQGQDGRLLSVGTADGAAAAESTSHFKILLDSVTLDGWIVIAILGVMFVLSIYVMVAKIMFVHGAARANDRFKPQFERLLAGVSATQSATGTVPADEKSAGRTHRGSPLYRLYESGVHELRNRFDAYAKANRAPVLTDQSINAIRATVDARLVRELQRANSQMVLLTICIAGGPFLGLLGTVVGVMITFAAIAAAGDVNVNAIAPGIAAALVATVAGLAVAIPALFAYNYLTTKISELTADMQVFIDEFVTRIAENHSV